MTKKIQFKKLKNLHRFLYDILLQLEFYDTLVKLEFYLQNL